MAKESLVAEIKALQRSDPGLKQAWWDYCDQEHEGIKDPNRHDEGSLQHFLNMNSGGGPPPQRAAPAKGPPKGGGFKGGSKGGGKMGGFAASYAAPAPVAANPSVSMPGDDLVVFVKVGQKLSSSFKDAWRIYCQAAGGGTNDPNRHHPQYIADFINYLGELAQADLASQVQYSPPMMMQQYSPPVSAKGGAKGMGKKRPNEFGGGEPPRKQAFKGGASGGGEKTALVDRIKALQRQDPEAKQAWWDFTDNFHGGIHDPNRHEPDVLSEFLANYT